MLAVLQLGNDAYGMEVRQEIESRTGREVSIGALYRTLARLETPATGAAALCAAALLATLIPALRSLRIDPVVALRSD